MNSIQRKSHGVTCVQRFNPGDDFVYTRVIKTGKFNWIRFTEWHIQITHPLEGKKYILSVEFARRLKPRRGMEFHAAPQMECVNFWEGTSRPETIWLSVPAPLPTKGYSGTSRTSGRACAR